MKHGENAFQAVSHSQDGAGPVSADAAPGEALLPGPAALKAEIENLGLAEHRKRVNGFAVSEDYYQSRQAAVWKKAGHCSYCGSWDPQTHIDWMGSKFKECPVKASWIEIGTEEYVWTDEKSGETRCKAACYQCNEPRNKKGEMSHMCAFVSAKLETARGCPVCNGKHGVARCPYKPKHMSHAESGNKGGGKDGRPRQPGGAAEAETKRIWRPKAAAKGADQTEPAAEGHSEQQLQQQKQTQYNQRWRDTGGWQHRQPQQTKTGRKNKKKGNLAPPEELVSLDDALAAIAEHQDAMPSLREQNATQATNLGRDATAVEDPEALARWERAKDIRGWVSQPLEGLKGWRTPSELAAEDRILGDMLTARIGMRGWLRDHEDDSVGQVAQRLVDGLYKELRHQAVDNEDKEREGLKPFTLTLDLRALAGKKRKHLQPLEDLDLTARPDTMEAPSAEISEGWPHSLCSALVQVVLARQSGPFAQLANEANRVGWVADQQPEPQPLVDTVTANRLLSKAWGPMLTALRTAAA